MSARLRLLTDAEVEQWYADHEAGYLADRVATGEPEGVARARLAEDQARYFPDRRPAARHELFAIDDGGRQVGVVWVGPWPRREDDTSVAWLFDLEVDQAYRGQGFGRAAMRLLEEHLAESGVRELGLNVFGRNVTARHLYARAGFRETFVSMAKRLTPPKA